MRVIVNFIFYLFLSLLISIDNVTFSNIDSNLLNKNYYFMINIPKIDLTVKVYHYKDKMNDVDKGIYLVKDYNFDNLEGSLILASHSGNSSISYFKNLHLLKKNDIVRIVLDNKELIYEINDVYKINKTGKFKYSNDDREIYLITCDKKNKKKQLVFRGKLIKIAKKSTFM